MPMRPSHGWDEDDDIIYCESLCKVGDVFYEGSEDEDYEDPKVRRQRYEAAGQRFLNGTVPLLLSASLRGPFDSTSGWTNPWKSCQKTKAVTLPKSVSAILSAAKKTGRKDSLLVPKKQDPVKNEDASRYLPSPESLKQALHSQSNAFVDEDSFDKVHRWRDDVTQSSSKAEMFWPSTERDTIVSAKKRRLTGSEWLKKASNKRQKVNSPGRTRKHVETSHTSPTAPSSPSFVNARSIGSPLVRKSPRKEMLKAQSKPVCSTVDNPNSSKFASAILSSPVSLQHAAGGSGAVSQQHHGKLSTTSSFAGQASLSVQSIKHDVVSAGSEMDVDDDADQNRDDTSLSDDAADEQIQMQLKNDISSHNLNQDNTSDAGDASNGVTPLRYLASDGVPSEKLLKDISSVPNQEGSVNINEDLSDDTTLATELLEKSETFQAIHSKAEVHGQGVETAINSPKSVHGRTALQNLASLSLESMEKHDYNTLTRDSGAEDLQLFRDYSQSTEGSKQQKDEPRVHDEHRQKLTKEVINDQDTISPMDSPAIWSLSQADMFAKASSAESNRSPLGPVSPNSGAIGAQMIIPIEGNKSSDLEQSSSPALQDANLSQPQDENGGINSGWRKPLLREKTPEPQFDFKSFASFMSPSPDRRRKTTTRFSSSISRSRMSTRQLTMPSALKSQTRRHRPNLRVTWAAALDSLGQGSIGDGDMKIASSTTARTRPASPPPETGLTGLSTSDNAKFSKHFEAVVARSDDLRPLLESKQPQRPTPSNSPITDQASIEDNAIVDPTQTSQMPDANQCSLESPRPMDIVADIFEEMSEFLQAWDVDTELDLARKGFSSATTEKF